MINIAPVIRTLRQRFVSQWGSDIPVTYDLQPDAPRATGAYCHFRVTRGTTDHNAGSIDTGEATQFGRVWLQVFVPMDQGDALAQSLLDRFGNIFGNWRNSDPEIYCHLPDVGPEGQVDGRFMMSVSVPYDAFLRY